MGSKLDDEGCRRLGMAVIKTVVKDYTKALRAYHKNPKDMRAKGIIMDCEAFFKKHFTLYAYDVNLDGESIMRMVQEMVKRELRIAA